MRLGVYLEPKSDDPDEIARAYLDAGYSAAVCPPVSLDQPERIKAIREAFARHDVLLAEVGAWNNMLDPDLAQRTSAIEVNVRKLALADELGASCCVNIAGSFNPSQWDGPDPRNLSEEAYELTVQNVRHIIDAVKPKRAFYCLEPMPWVIPDSVESYLRLINAIDRDKFGVHLDPVNLVNSPHKYFDNAELLRECFTGLGQWIISCHGKDIRMQGKLTVHLDEMPPGQGELDYGVFLKELSRLPVNTPLILEHLAQEEYPAARAYVVGVARKKRLVFYECASI
jgi:sugar phosphate isomerase/epimerase